MPDKFIDKIEQLGFPQVAEELRRDNTKPAKHYTEKIMNANGRSENKWNAIEMVVFATKNPEHHA
jgi:hypothetical protein